MKNICNILNLNAIFIYNFTTKIVVLADIYIINFLKIYLQLHINLNIIGSTLQFSFSFFSIMV